MVKEDQKKLRNQLVLLKLKRRTKNKKAEDQIFSLF
jgi:hypothetical protein